MIHIADNDNSFDTICGLNAYAAMMIDGTSIVTRLMATQIYVFPYDACLDCWREVREIPN